MIGNITLNSRCGMNLILFTQSLADAVVLSASIIIYGRILPLKQGDMSLFLLC